MCQHYKDGSTRELQQPAEKQGIHASKNEADKRVEEMVCTISSLKVMQSLSIIDYRADVISIHATLPLPGVY